MKRRILYENTGGSIDPSLSTACDICFYNNKRQQLEIVTYDQWNTGGTTAYPATTYTPIGVVVIPGTHGVLKDSSNNVQCGVISLKNMNYETPDTGSTSVQYMYWGHYSADTSLTNYNRVVTASNATANNASGNKLNGYLPLNGSYQNSSYIPSPYKGSNLKSGDFNTAYNNTSTGTASNALSDFDGPGNTAVLTDLATAQSDWRTASTITNGYNNRYYPAACCCWRYSTPGTQQGDWYLPSCGELGYVIPKFSDINTTIEALITAYGDTVGVKLSSGNLWSSSEYSQSEVRVVLTSNGSVAYGYKYDRNYHVRAFLRV